MQTKLSLKDDGNLGERLIVTLRTVKAVGRGGSVHSASAVGRGDNCMTASRGVDAIPPDRGGGGTCVHVQASSVGLVVLAKAYEGRADSILA